MRYYVIFKYEECAFLNPSISTDRNEIEIEFQRKYDELVKDSEENLTIVNLWGEMGGKEMECSGHDLIWRLVEFEIDDSVRYEDLWVCADMEEDNYTQIGHCGMGAFTDMDIHWSEKESELQEGMQCLNAKELIYDVDSKSVVTQHIIEHDEGQCGHCTYGVMLANVSRVVEDNSANAEESEPPLILPSDRVVIVNGNPYTMACLSRILKSVSSEIVLCEGIEEMIDLRDKVKLLRYNYFDAVKADVRKFVCVRYKADDILTLMDKGRKAFITKVKREAADSDEVTGGARQSYFRNKSDASVALCHNLSDYLHVLEECGMTPAEAIDSPDKADALIRVSELDEAVPEVLDELVSDIKEHPENHYPFHKRTEL